MRVLIVGSIRGETSDARRTRFFAACRDLGRALAAAGHDLVVASDDPETADPYVVEGALADPGPRKIWVFRPRVGHTPFETQRADHAQHVTFIYQVVDGPWDAVRVPQVEAADAVLLVGGGPGTAQIGYVAPALERPVLAIPSFGGAASQLWSVVEKFYARLPSSLRTEMGNLRVDWQPANAELAVRILDAAARDHLFRRESTPLASVVLFVASLVLFSAWVWWFIDPVGQHGFAFFVLLAFSAFLGTALRTALSLLTDATSHLSPGRAITELTAGLLLAFGLAIGFLIGGFTITGEFDFISSTDGTEDFQRIALALSALGFAAGWLIERVADALRQWFSDQLNKPFSSGAAR